MRIQAWDSEFVRARRIDVHPIVRDVAGYGRWWPRADSRVAGDRVALTLRPPGLRPGLQRLLVTVVRDRPAKGVRLIYAGDLAGDAEWYYLDEPTGVVVHYLVKAEVADRGWRRRLRGHRATVRQALHSLKDRLEAGRLPGAEPDPRLVAHQRDAMAEMRADSEAHATARRTAAGGR